MLNHITFMFNFNKEVYIGRIVAIRLESTRRTEVNVPPPPFP